MLKPLLPAIPSKTLSLEGKDYEVYDIVNIQNKVVNDTTYKQLFVSINATVKRKSLRVFPGIENHAERFRAIHLYIEDVVTHLNDFVEQNYVGDRLRYCDLKEKYTLVKAYTPDCCPILPLYETCR